MRPGTRDRGTARLSVAAGLAVLLSLAGCSTPLPQASPAEPASATPSPSPGRTAPMVTPDFDGDGGADVVVGIGSNPGRVSIRYANGGSLDLRRADVDPANADSIDFGQALLARDLNGDGFTDLLVADPGDTAPAVFWIYGSARGLDLSGRVITPTTMAMGAGRALALVSRPEPVVLVGGGSIEQEGVVLGYPLGADGRPGGDPERVTPQSLALPALPAGSRFGATLAAAGTLLAIGAPGMTVGSARQAGAVFTVDYGVQPLRTNQLTQDSPGVADAPQSGDRFGASLAAGEGYLVVGAPGDDREDGSGHNRVGAGLVQPFRIVGHDLQPVDALDERNLPGDVAAGDAFGSAVAVMRPCTNTVGVLVGALAKAIGTNDQAGSVWVVPLGGTRGCRSFQLSDGKGLADEVGTNTVVGSAVGVLRTSSGGDTLVIVAQGNSEEGVPGRVLTVDHPYRQAAVEVLRVPFVVEERRIVLSSPEG